MGLLGDLTGGLLGTSSLEKAGAEAKAISERSKKDILAELDTSWSDIEGYLNPYIESGSEALSLYKDKIGAEPTAQVFDEFSFSFDDYQDSDAYKFLVETGTQAVDRIAAKNRGLGSGNRMIAMADYIKGLNSQEYGNEFNRQLKTYGTNRDTGLLNYETATNKYDRNMGNLWNVQSQGYNATTNKSSLRDSLARQRTGAHSNYAAEQAAAAFIPAQEKSSFINNAISAGALYAGARAGAK